MSTRSRPTKTLLTFLPVLLLLAAIATGVTLTQQHRSAHAASGGCGTPSAFIDSKGDGYAGLDITFPSYEFARVKGIRATGSWVNYSTDSRGWWNGSVQNSNELFIETHPGHGGVTWSGTVQYGFGAHTSCSATISVTDNV